MDLPSNFLYHYQLSLHVSLPLIYLDYYINELNSVNNFKITLNKIDCDKYEKLADKYKIEAYPTIKLLYKGKVYNYEARPDKKRLVEFLETFVDQTIDNTNKDNIIRK